VINPFIHLAGGIRGSVVSRRFEPKGPKQNNPSFARGVAIASCQQHPLLL
jgi:hypothetical protein